MNIAIIDNYDSFTYNLVHLIEKIVQQDVTVFLNDVFSKGRKCIISSTSDNVFGIKSIGRPQRPSWLSFLL